MAKIIILGELNTSPLYISVDGRREKMVSGKGAYYMDVAPGKHKVFVSTQSPFMRRNNDGGFASRLDASQNTSLDGEILLDESDALLLEAKLKGMKSIIENRVMSLSEAGNYVDMNALREVGAKKWTVLILCLFFGIFGVHRFYEKKYVTGIIYLLTMGLGGIGVAYDFIKILLYY